MCYSKMNGIMALHTVEWELLCVDNICVLGSALVIYNYNENKYTLTIFANGSMTK